MYNILEVEDKIKGLPDQALMKEAQFPSGDVPQFLVVSEIQRRNEMRKSYDAMQQPSSTAPVAQQIVAEAAQGISGLGGNALPVSAPMQAQTPMAPPMQSSMPAPQAPAGIVGMQDGRTVPGISTGGGQMGRPWSDDVIFERKVSEILATMPTAIGRLGVEQRRRNRQEAERLAREELYGVDYSQEYITKFDPIEQKPNLDTLENLSPEDAATVESYTGLDLVPGTDYDPSGVLSQDLPFGLSQDPAGSGNALSEDLSRMNAGIMEATKEGRGIISNLRTQLGELQPYEAAITDRQYIADDIDRQSYIDRLSAIAAEDVTARESLIDELQDKSKKDALNAFLISLGAGIAGGDISKGIEEGGKAAMDVKQLAEQRVFAEQKALRDVKSAAEREAVQLGLSAEEAALAGDRAAQQFDMQQESLRNTAEFQNYTVARDSLVDQLAAAREDVTTIAALIKSEADIVNDANRIKADMAREAGTERRSIRDYIEELVSAQRDTLEASVVGMTDPSAISQVVENYRNALEAALGLPSSRVEPSTFQLSGSPPAVDELVGFSINR